MPTLLHHLLDAAAAGVPGKEALVDGEARLSYADLDARARTCAATLEDCGVDRRDRVAIYLPKSTDEVACIFGVSRAGGVFVPVNPLLRPAQVNHIVRDCGVKVLITDGARWETLRPTLANAPDLECVLLVDDLAGEPGPRAVARAFETPRRHARPAACIGEDLAAILYTSGSTGRPKGVMLSHRNLLAGSRIVRTYLNMTADERLLSLLPFSFDYGLNQLITSVDAGATIVLKSFRFGNEIVRALDAEKITGLAGVPTIWAVLTQATPSFKTTELPHLRYLTNSGGAVPEPTVRALRSLHPHVDLVLMYGLTEAFRSTYLPPSEVDARPTSMGRAIPETEVFLLDADGQRCGVDEPGILYHRGPTVSLGYWNRPDATAEVLVPNPLIPPNQGVDVVCRSGDLVRMDADGYLYFVGRNDAMIKCTGYRVSPTEVEEVLMAHGGLAQAAVIGLPDPTTGQRVHAVVTAAEDAAVDIPALLAHCAKELPPHMVPREVEVVDALPRSPNGKVDYKLLRAERVEKMETA